MVSNLFFRSDHHVVWHAQLFTQNACYPYVVNLKCGCGPGYFLQVTCNADTHCVKAAQTALGVIRPFVFVFTDSPLLESACFVAVRLCSNQGSVCAYQRKLWPGVLGHDSSIVIHYILKMTKIYHEIVITRRVKKLAIQVIVCPLHCSQSLQRHAPKKQNSNNENMRMLVWWSGKVQAYLSLCKRLNPSFELLLPIMYVVIAVIIAADCLMRENKSGYNWLHTIDNSNVLRSFLSISFKFMCCEVLQLHPKSIVLLYQFNQDIRCKWNK